MGMWETRHGTDHRLILAVLRVEEVLHNLRYQGVQTLWPIRPKAVRLYIKGRVDFAEIKGGIKRTLWPMKARLSWISQET